MMSKLNSWLATLLGTQPASESLRKHRSIPLDCIRSFAVIAVVIYHVGTRYDAVGFDAIAAFFRKFGHFGVDIFFPLSGYLITSYLLRMDPADGVRAFFMRRFFRIVPLYMVAVTLWLMVSLVLGIDREFIDRIWITYLFLTGWFIFFDGDQEIIYKITWSLSVEEFAYILLGLVAWLMRKRFVTFLVSVSVGAILLRLYLSLNGYWDVHFFPPARLDSIAIGGITAYLVSRQQRGLPAILAGLVLLTWLTAALFPFLWSTLQYLIITFGTCALISLFEMPLRSWKSASAPGLDLFASIGFHSYFIYLFHMFFIDGLLLVLKRVGDGTLLPFWLMVTMAILATHIAAVLSFRLFEGPLIKYGRSLEGRKTTPASSPAKEGT